MDRMGKDIGCIIGLMTIVIVVLLAIVIFF